MTARKPIGSLPSAYGLTFGMYWATYHSDQTNGALARDHRKRWIERVIGEQEPLDPATWRLQSPDNVVANHKLTSVQRGDSALYDDYGIRVVDTRIRR